MKQLMERGKGEKVYGPSIQVKTWEKPHDRTWASDSLRDGGAMVAGVFDCQTYSTP